LLNCCLVTFIKKMSGYMCIAFNLILKKRKNPYQITKIVFVKSRACCLITKGYFIIMSPNYKMGRHIVFRSAVCLSVRSSVHPSVTLSCSLYIFRTLVGLTNNSAQMSSMISRYAVRMCDQGRFKVKFHETMCRAHVLPRQL